MNDTITEVWHIDDVRALCDGHITDDQCREVLAMADKYYDANIGINLGVLRVYIDDVLNDPESLDDRYQIYIACMHGTGIPVKTYDEWLSC
jgi:hypothetical protein